MIPFEVIALSPYARELFAEIGARKGVTRFRDTQQREIELRAWQGDDWSGVAALYDTFFPSADRRRALPALNAQQRTSWLEELTTRGPNAVALIGGRVIGHAALVGSDDARSHELVLFVHRDYRGAGIGRALHDAVLDLARREGVMASTPPSNLTDRLVSAFGRGVGVRLGAVLGAVRLVMIPLVCAATIAVVSEDPHGRTLAIILAVASLLFGLGVQMRTIVLGRPDRPPLHPVANTGEWMARLQ
jgi:GNAT superfamily N-acetyltransferase